MVRLKGYIFPCYGWPRPFQFHYGSIKGGIVTTEEAARIDFNSTMVRLKESRSFRLWWGFQEFQFHYGSIKGHFARFLPGVSLNFNSTMVRLKEAAAIVLTNSFLFQFHYGSIKGSYLFNICSGSRYFNSTMVRLKVRKPQGSLQSCCDFNSTMVRLKGRAWRPVLRGLAISIPLWFG